jgi:hypothetical protein
MADLPLLFDLGPGVNQIAPKQRYAWQTRQIGYYVVANMG